VSISTVEHVFPVAEADAEEGLVPKSMMWMPSHMMWLAMRLISLAIVRMYRALGGTSTPISFSTASQYPWFMAKPDR